MKQPQGRSCGDMLLDARQQNTEKKGLPEQYVNDSFTDDRGA